MQEVARVYAEALVDVAKEKGKLDAIRDQLAQLSDAVDGDRDLQVFFFSPYFSSAEKIDGAKRAIVGADPEFVNFLALLIEKQRITEIFRIRMSSLSSSRMSSSTMIALADTSSGSSRGIGAPESGRTSATTACGGADLRNCGWAPGGGGSEEPAAHIAGVRHRVRSVLHVRQRGGCPG